MTKFKLTLLSAAICLATSTATFAAMSKADYKAAKDTISAKYKSDKAACGSMSANAKDICIEEAKGREKVAKAELEDSYNPTDKHRYNIRKARADADYAVAKEKCDDLAGNPKSVCRKEAKSAFVTAKANAKLAEKTSDANATAREKTSDARKDANADKNDAAYAVAKEKCDAFANEAKASCMKDAKARFGKT